MIIRVLLITEDESEYLLNWLDNNESVSLPRLSRTANDLLRPVTFTTMFLWGGPNHVMELIEYIYKLGGREVLEWVVEMLTGAEIRIGVKACTVL